MFVPKRLRRNRILALPVQHAHALQAAALPPHHRDPFDRLLVAQTQLEKLALLTADAQLRACDVEIITAGTD